jgi:hypothetical protein
MYKAENIVVYRLAGITGRGHRSRLEVQLSETHLLWIGLVVLIVGLAIAVAALMSLPVRPRR